MTEIQTLLQNIEAQISQNQLALAKDNFKKLPFAQFTESSDLIRFGILALRLRHVHAAIQIFSRGIELYPNHHVFHNNLGTAYLEIPDLIHAEKNFQRALELKPDYAIAAFNLGSVYDRDARLELARSNYLRALKIQPDHYQALARLALIAEREVRREELNEFAERAFVLNPHHPDVLYARSYALWRSGKPDEALEALEEAIGLVPQNPTYRFHQGKLLEVLGRNAEAYVVFEQANQLARPKNDVRRKFLSDHERLMKWYQNEIPALETQSAKPGTPLYVLGCPRSGTTLVAEMLGSHSKIKNYGELDILEQVYIEAINTIGCGDEIVRVCEELWLKDNPQLISHLRIFYEKLLSDLPERNATQYWLDKGIQNTFFLPLVIKLCPEAAFLFVIRDGRETAFSIFKQNFAELFWFKYELTDALVHWVQTVATVRQAHTKLKPNLSEVYYEKIVADPRTELQRIFGFLNLEFEEQCLEFHQNKELVKTQSYAQVRERLYTSALHHTRDHYPAQYQEMTRFAHKALTDFGYEI